MCVFIAIIATIVPVILWHVNKAADWKYNGYELESWLAGHLNKGSVH